MRKSQLLERIPKTYLEHNSCRIIRASGQKVLMTILPSWEVINRQKEKVIFHFTWKDGYLTYYPSYNEWTREQLSTLYYNAYLSQSGLDEKSIEIYAHMQMYVVKPGEFIRRYQLIGYMGNTGLSVGPHLHYEVWENNHPVNPLA